MTGLVRLLEIIESGKPGRFDNSRRAVMLPKQHSFSATCDCFECDQTWERRA